MRIHRGMSILTHMQKGLYKDLSTAEIVVIKFLKVLSSAISVGKEWITKEKHIE